MMTGESAPSTVSNERISHTFPHCGVRVNHVQELESMTSELHIHILGFEEVTCGHACFLRSPPGKRRYRPFEYWSPLFRNNLHVSGVQSSLVGPSL